MRNKLLLSSLFALTFMLAACGTQPVSPTEAPQAETTDAPEVEMTEAPAEMITPAVTVNDQDLENGSVTIVEIISDGQGWIVIHAQADGKPGSILGFSPVSSGENNDVVVEIDTSQATETLYAMLHADAGEMGEFEFPDGPDEPVNVDGQVVTPSFLVGLPASQATITVAQSDEFGSFLVDENGITLYVFQDDPPGMSTCSGGCADNWPPVLTDNAPEAGEGVASSLLGTIERDDGTMQVTYNNWPLYYFVSDAHRGDMKGQGVQDAWYVISPAGELITQAEEVIDY
jgi:predicted lipoprotein with Yx(FWY)xxD motif